MPHTPTTDAGADVPAFDSAYIVECLQAAGTLETVRSVAGDWCAAVFAGHADHAGDALADVSGMVQGALAAGPCVAHGLQPCDATLAIVARNGQTACVALFVEHWRTRQIARIDLGWLAIDDPATDAPAFDSAYIAEALRVAGTLDTNHEPATFADADYFADHLSNEVGAIDWFVLCIDTQTGSATTNLAELPYPLRVVRDNETARFVVVVACTDGTAVMSLRLAA